MKILLLSPYHAKSHQMWCDGLMQNIEADWTLLSLSPRHFSWRIRGNSLTWAFSKAKVLSQKFDLIIATSMTDLNSLFGFVPDLASTPSILYFHENQFSYPAACSAIDNVESKIVPLYSALSADHLCFNTKYNYETFLAGAREFFREMPDNVPPGLIEKIETKSTVLPVPIIPDSFQLDKKTNDVFTIVWNHRWEHDKWPECFFEALKLFSKVNIQFDLHMLGEQFNKQPDIFDDAEKQFSKHIKSWGRVEDVTEYRKILSSSHIVISTALHDFQGLAILEAVAAGCVPIVPDRLAYCELFESKYRYPSDTDDMKAQAIKLAEIILNRYEKFKDNKLELAPDVSSLSWDVQSKEYMKLIKKVIGN